MVEFILEILLEICGEFLLGAGIEILVAPFRSSQKASPFFAFLGLMILGGVSGLLVSLVLPNKLIPFSRFPGISLFLSPFITGLALYIFGRWRRSNEKNTTVLAMFWGGAFFSFVFALTRYWMVSK